MKFQGDAAVVGSDGLRADLKLPGNFLLSMPEGDPPQYLGFPLAQDFLGRMRRGVAKSQCCLGELRVYVP